MASPFHIFRKYQRITLVVVGLLCMISFVILGPLMDTIGGRTSGPVKNPLVVSSSYGDLHRFDVERLRMLQSILYNFLNTADQQSWTASGGDPNRWRPTRPSQVDDRYAIETFLLAGKAKEMGIVVDDEVINFRLKQFGLSENRLRDLLAGYMVDGFPMSMNLLFEAYRTDLLASRVRQAYGLAVPDRPRTAPPTIYTPAESFESYCKLHEQVQIESVAVPAEQFIDQVKDPSKEVLQAFFDKYKDKIDLPMMVGGVQMPAPEPGFKQPPQAQFHYLEGNYLAYLDLAKQQVTDEEVAKYYEDNKRQFEKLNLLDAPGEKAPGGLDLELPELDKLPGDGTSPTLEVPAEPAVKEPAAETTPEAKQESSEEKPADEKPTAPAAAEENPANAPAPEAKSEAAAEEKPAAESEQPTAEEKPADAEKPGEEKPAEAASQSVIVDGRQATLVSFQADAEGTPAEAASAEEKPAPAEAKPDDAPATDEKPADAPDAEAKPDTPAAEVPPSEKPADAAPAVPEGTPPVPAEEKTDADLPEFEKKPADETPTEKTPASERGKEYKPLEEVADEIRQTLAEQRAGLSMLAAIEPLQLELQNYWKPKLRKSLVAGDKATAELPEGFLAKAEKSHLVFKETLPLSYFQLNDIPLGQAGVPTGDDLSQTTKLPFAQYAFIGQMEQFQAVLAEGDDGNKYLAWKVGEKEEKVPELDEVRDLVVKAWKLIEARKLAEAEAKRLADLAAKSKDSLDRSLGTEGVSVLFSQPFTWMTRGNVSQFDFNAQSRLSEISGITGADDDFMKKIFGLKEGEVTTIENYPKTAFYVVRLSQKVIPAITLRENYLRDEQTHPFLRPWDQQAQRRVMSDVYDALLAEVEADAKVTWHEPEADELEPEQEN